jgi:hypothetical protein
VWEVGRVALFIVTIELQALDARRRVEAHAACVLPRV